MHPYYRDKFGYQSGDFPHASGVFERIVSLPIYPKMTEAEVERVVEAVRSIATQYRQ
jgi:dTDP-4-amino-4,6-dideoxygalactose transaminase